MQPPLCQIVIKLENQVQQSMPAIASKDQELSQQSQKLQLAKSERDDIKQDFLSTKRNISSSETEISDLQEEKNNLEEMLKLKEEELDILKESSVKMMSVKQKEIEVEKLQEANDMTKQELDQLHRQQAAAKISEVQYRLHTNVRQINQGQI